MTVWAVLSNVFYLNANLYTHNERPCSKDLTV